MTFAASSKPIKWEQLHVGKFYLCESSQRNFYLDEFLFFLVVIANYQFEKY